MDAALYQVHIILPPEVNNIPQYSLFPVCGEGFSSRHDSRDVPPLVAAQKIALSLSPQLVILEIPIYLHTENLHNQPFLQSFLGLACELDWVPFGHLNPVQQVV